MKKFMFLFLILFTALLTSCETSDDSTEGPGVTVYVYSFVDGSLIDITNNDMSNQAELLDQGGRLRLKIVGDKPLSQDISNIQIMSSDTGGFILNAFTYYPDSGGDPLNITLNKDPGDYVFADPSTIPLDLYRYYLYVTVQDIAGNETALPQIVIVFNI